MFFSAPYSYPRSHFLRALRDRGERRSPGHGRPRDAPTIETIVLAVVYRFSKPKAQEIRVKRENAAAETYRETLDYLFGLQRFGIKLGLENITTLLEILGNPHRAFPSVHIAGSNGKGSTAAFLDSILRQSGLRTGLYTSPHLVDFSERIQINGKAIPTRRIGILTEKIRAHVGEMERRGCFQPKRETPASLSGREPEKATLTFFEFTTAMMFQYF